MSHWDEFSLCDNYGIISTYKPDINSLSNYIDMQTLNNLCHMSNNHALYIYLLSFVFNICKILSLNRRYYGLDDIMDYIILI